MGPTGSQEKLRETLSLVETTLTKEFSDKSAQMILEAVDDVASSKTTSTGVNFPLPMPLDSGKLPLSMVLQGITNIPLAPGTDGLVTQRGQEGQSGRMAVRATYGSEELHCTPAHTQVAAHHTELGTSRPAVNTTLHSATPQSRSGGGGAARSGSVNAFLFRQTNPLPAGPANTILLV